MSWNANNRAHACLWTFETWHHDKRDLGFDEVGSWTTDFIIKSAAGDGNDMRNRKVKAHASLLDDAFTGLYRSSYENGIDQETAITTIEAVLSDNSKTMADLADAVDNAYKVRGEL